jgi:hypothetical protein
MLYDPAIPDDVQGHNEYHDKVLNGLLSLSIEDKDVVWSCDNIVMSVVRHQSTKEKRRHAEEVASLARRDTSYDAEALFSDIELETHVYLLHNHNRTIGLLTIDKRTHVWQTSWADIDAGVKPRELSEHPSMWSICFIWILQKCRRSKFGKAMIDQAISHLGKEIETIGWYTPFTDSGRSLVKHYCPDEFKIAK